MIHESFRVIDMSGGVVNQFPFIRLLAPDLSGYRPLVNTLKPLWRFIKVCLLDEIYIIMKYFPLNFFVVKIIY